MKKILLLLSTFSMASYILYGQCTPNASNIFTFNALGKTYEIIKEPLNWTQAAACAATRGGHLAEINSQSEQDAITTNIALAGINNASTMAPDGGGASYLWIGGNDLAAEGTWIWDGDNNGAGPSFWQGNFLGNPVGGLYNNWGIEPDNFLGAQDNLGFALTNWPLGTAGEWNDLASGNLLYYIIEKPLVPLPLSLIYFNGEYKNNKVSLQWKMSNLANLKHIEIERNSNGTNSFITVGKISITDADSYQFQDSDFIRGLLLYRLKIVDKDEHCSYSATLLMDTGKEEIILNYTNPASGHLSIKGLNSKGQIRIIDLSGKKQIEKAVESETISVDLSSLSNGLYLFQYIYGNSMVVRKFYKE